MLPQHHKMFDTLFYQILEKGVKHGLTRKDFFYIYETKQKKQSERRIQPNAACEILLNHTNLKNLHLSTNAKVGFYRDSKRVFGSLSEVEIKLFLIRILETVGDKRLLKPYFVNEVLKCLKSSRIANHGPILLLPLSNKQ